MDAKDKVVEAEGKKSMEWTQLLNNLFHGVEWGRCKVMLRMEMKKNVKRDDRSFQQLTGTPPTSRRGRRSSKGKDERKCFVYMKLDVNGGGMDV